MSLALALLVAAAPPPATAAPAAAPVQGPVEKLRQVVVRAIRNCPTPKDPEEIVVCSRDRGVAEAFRLPKMDPRYERAARTAARASAAGGGQALGTGSCSAAGSAGQTGCSLAEANAWAAEKRQAGDD